METKIDLPSLPGKRAPVPSIVTIRPEYEELDGKPFIGDSVNSHSVEQQNHLFLTNATACLVEWKLKTPSSTVKDISTLAATINTLSLKEANYLCLCACRYLSKEEFGLFLKSGAAPKNFDVASEDFDEGDDEPRYYCYRGTPHRCRNWYHPEENSKKT